MTWASLEKDENILLFNRSGSKDIPVYASPFCWTDFVGQARRYSLHAGLRTRTTTGKQSLAACFACLDAALNARALEQDPEAEGWVERLQKVDQVEAEQLSRIHGKLIALGFLKFELGNRHAGVQYKITRSGQRALNSITQKSHPDAA